MQEKIVKLLQELVRNECVNPPGNEMKSIRKISIFLDSHDIQHEVFESTPERGNLLATIKGSGEKPSLMLGPGHVDVVPVENPSNWEVPPFSGEIKDGCVWGRGTYDMLGVVACQVVVFTELINSGFKPKGDLKLLIVSDEEALGTYGADWMVKNHPDKVKVDYLFTEFGGPEIAPKRPMFAYGEKGAPWARLVAKGREQHGSMPYKSDNAIVTLSKAIDALAKYNPPLTTEYLQVFLKEMPISGFMKWLVSKKRLLPRVISMLSKRDMSQASVFHALSRMTISPDVIEGGTKINVVPSSASVDLDIRSLPGQDMEYVTQQIKKALGPLWDHVELDFKSYGTETSLDCWGCSSDIRSPLVEVWEQITQEIMGADYKLVPWMMTGATDARFFRIAFGTQAYGMGLACDTLTISELFGIIHGDNERIPLKTLELTSKGYKMLVERFLG